MELVLDSLDLIAERNETRRRVAFHSLQSLGKLVVRQLQAGRKAGSDCLQDRLRLFAVGSLATRSAKANSVEVLHSLHLLYLHL